MTSSSGSVSQETNFLYARRLPGRVGSREAARLLGFGEHDLPVLIATRLLRPLGTPAPNAPKYFATFEVVQYTQDLKWLNRATEAVAKNWKKKNEARRQDALAETDTK